jgi:soluble P-type ATPase
MLEVSIPGFAVLRLKHLVLDYNGTLAVDGALVSGVKERLESLSRVLSLHVLTADTFGTARIALAGVPCELSILALERQDLAKKAYVERLGATEVVCIGNGRNDRLMLWSAALGIAVLHREGSAMAAVSASDLVVPDIIDALDLLDNPRRLVASLRA